MRASVHASCFSHTDVCLEAEGISCLPLAQAQGQAKHLLLSQKGWLAIAKLKPLSLFISLLSMPKKAFDNVKQEK